MPIRDGIPAPAATAADLNDRPRPNACTTKTTRGKSPPTTPPKTGGATAVSTTASSKTPTAISAKLLDASRRHGHHPSFTLPTTATGSARTGWPSKGRFFTKNCSTFRLAVSWPGRLPQGAAVRALTTHADVLPTLCDLAGIPAPPDRDGLSLRPLLEGGGWERDAVFAEYHSSNAGSTLRGPSGPTAGSSSNTCAADASSTTWPATPEKPKIWRALRRAKRPSASFSVRLDEWAARTHDSLWFRYRPRELR